MKREARLRRIFRGYLAVLSLITLTIFLGACDRSSQPPANASNPISSDSVGQKIQFRQGGNSEPYRISGWSHTETDFTWTEGTSAKLGLPLSSASGPLTLKVSMSGLIKPPDRPSQTVEVYANDQKIAEWQVANLSEFSATIPGEVTKTGATLTIEFRTPNAISPKELGVNADPRVLGVCVRSVELTKG